MRVREKAGLKQGASFGPPTRVHEPKYVGHFLLFFQGHEQGDESDLVRLGL